LALVTWIFAAIIASTAQPGLNHPEIVFLNRKTENHTIQLRRRVPIVLVLESELSFGAILAHYTIVRY
jgi:hypothetical protein